ncbi:hypothetical protein BGZ65_010179 [Modicella reniformis]|uniref:Uncharacterized protein n=1 Tax=Modicella reniformis TaxID=1440133 RepID=A0A9P6M787_9FUNG|nr:hypothetical protein BGZ65_010179 [Modicella reniformis]
MIRLQFIAYNRTFYLHLEPNLDFIHPEAELGEGISHDEILAFKGIVVEDELHSERKWDRVARTSRAEKQTVEYMLYEEGVLGWARMMIEHDPKKEGAPVLRGAFMANEETYHVTTQEHYHIQKRSDDAVPSSFSPISNSLIIYRNSDLYTRHHNSLRRKRGLNPLEESSSSCGADLLLPSTSPGAESEAEDVSPFHEYYHPPNLTTSIPELSSSWSNIWKSTLKKRGVEIKGVGPHPVPEGCPANRLVNYMATLSQTDVRPHR